MVPIAIQKCRRGYEGRQLVEPRVQDHAKHGLNGATQPINMPKTRWEEMSAEKFLAVAF